MRKMNEAVGRNLKRFALYVSIGTICTISAVLAVGMGLEGCRPNSNFLPPLPIPLNQARRVTIFDTTKLPDQKREMHSLFDIDERDEQNGRELLASLRETTDCNNEVHPGQSRYMLHVSIYDSNRMGEMALYDYYPESGWVGRNLNVDKDIIRTEWCKVPETFRLEIERRIRNSGSSSRAFSGMVSPSQPEKTRTPESVRGVPSRHGASHGGVNPPAFRQLKDP